MKGTGTFRKARFQKDSRSKIPEFANNRNKVSEKYPTKKTKRKVYGS